MKLDIPESQVVKSCLHWLLIHGCYVWRNNTGAHQNEKTKSYIRYGLPGSADIIGLTPSGKFIAIECKSAKGKLKYTQITFGNRILEKNGIYLVARSIDDLERNKEKFI